MTEALTPLKEPLTRGRRLYRGLIFAIMVGVVGAGLSIIPALFVQAIFVGEQQREFDIATTGEIITQCADDLSDQPVWLPVALIAGGGLAGMVGGMGYGYASPAAPARRFEEGDDSYLPF